MVSAAGGGLPSRARCCRARSAHSTAARASASPRPCRSTCAAPCQRAKPRPSATCRFAKVKDGVVWCGVVWCGVVWCGVVWCGVVWCGVVWCGVVWCGVVWCGVVWCGVNKKFVKVQKSRLVKSLCEL